LLLCCGLSAACSVNKKAFSPPVHVAETFSHSGDTPWLERWWLNFNDDGLSRLIVNALTENLDLLATYSRLEQAKAVAAKTGAELIPALNALTDAQGSLDGHSGNSLMGDFSVAFAAGYELDLWGRIRAGIKAAKLDIESARQDIDTAAITLTAEIASAWYQLIEQRKLLRLLNAQIEMNKQYVKLVNVRFRAGIATPADVFQQQQLLEGVIGDRYTVQATIDVLLNQLAILSGQSPGQFTIETPDEFPELGDMPVTGLTSDLIARRPDIQKAYYRLQAADLRIAAAVADRLPKLSLSASINTSAPNLDGLFLNWMDTLAGNLLLPIIDGGRRIAEVDRNEALTNEALRLYGQTILQAINEVENALSQEQRQHQRVESLKTQLQYLNDANTNIAKRSAYGAFDFLRILSTLNSLQAMQRTLLRAQGVLIGFRIDLYRALAGHWPQAPTAEG